MLSHSLLEYIYHTVWTSDCQSAVFLQIVQYDILLVDSIIMIILVCSIVC